MNKKLIATRNDPAVLVRFPRDVLKKVDQAAAQTGRSRNTEIIHRLAESLKPQPSQSAAQAG